ncbi:MAG: flagellin [Planctomycetota bacterium]
MGLGIGNISSSHTGVSQLQKTMNQILNLSTQLSTGTRINKASDAPAGLVISERLGAQFEALRQGLENSQRSANVVETADSALGEASGLLRKARELAVASGDSTLSQGERAANQAELDSILGSLDRIGATVNFGGQQLLDGSQQARTSQLSAGIDSVRVDQVGNAGGDFPRPVNVELTAQATRGTLGGTLTGQVADTQIRISGSKGSAVLDIAAGTDANGVAEAINAVKDQTGVESVGGEVRSADLGSGHYVDVEELSGTLNGITAGRAQGTDAQGFINGVTASGSGTSLSVRSGDLSATVTFDDTAAAGDYSFQVDSPGFTTYLGDGQHVGLGIGRVAPDSLGGTSGQGTLQSLYTGGANDLRTNPSGAVAVIDAAQNELLSQRGRLGAFTSQVLESSGRIFEQSSFNVAESRSRIRDTDYAQTLSELSSARIRQQAQTSLLAQSNLMRGNLVGLLLPS